MTEGMAELFLKYDYVETKDLAKAFLTLVSGILVLSITFSEMIVGVSTGGRKARFALAACWVLLICALLSCGLALVLITYAAGEAIYGGEGYLTVAWRSRGTSCSSPGLSWPQGSSRWLLPVCSPSTKRDR
jgi:hypothetical protein